MILRERCNTSYDLPSLFRGRRNTLDTVGYMTGCLKYLKVPDTAARNNKNIEPQPAVSKLHAGF